jgi:selenocysteine lyase/cysteine desulfurase
MGSQFLPALNSGDNFIFFDNGAEAQVPQVVLDAVVTRILVFQAYIRRRAASRVVTVHR